MAACNGGDDSAALADWLSYGHSLGTRAVLFIPPGCLEGIFANGGPSFSTDITITCGGFGTNPNPNTTVQNAVIWGYGATFANFWFGGQGAYSDQNPNATETTCLGAGNGPTNTSPLIQAANVGDTFVTAITPSDLTGNFAAGDWIVVTALGLQGCGSHPISPHIWEFKLITSVNTTTGVVTLNEPLRNSGYKTTYPIIGPSGSPCTSPYDGGAAAIILLQKSYNTISQYYGLTVNAPPISNEVLATGRNVSLIDVNVFAGGGFAPSVGENLSFIFGSYNNIENDKLIDTLTYFGSNLYANNTVQSSSIHNLIMTNTYAKGMGTPLNATISNSTFGSLVIGPTCCGLGNSVILDNVKITAPFDQAHFSLTSNYSLSSGTLTISKTASEWLNGKGPGLWVPGNKYFLSDDTGETTCVPFTTFTVSDIIDAGANVQIVTDLASIPSGNICSGFPVGGFAAFHVKTLTQKFTGPYFLNFLDAVQP